MTELATEILSGTRCSVTIEDDAVLKVTHDLYGPEAAQALMDDLQVYSDQLAQSPLTVAPAIEIGTESLPNDLVRIWHTQEHINGPTLGELPSEARVKATRQILGEIARMETIGVRGLETPIDAWEGNFRVDANGVAHFVDLMLPMVRRPNKSFAAPMMQRWDKASVSNPTLVMARLLRSISDSPTDSPTRVEVLAMLPEELTAVQHVALRGLTVANNLPYRLVRKATRPLARLLPQG